MIRISSNATIFFRIFVPVFLLVFYFLFVIMTWLNALANVDFPLWFKISNTIFFLSMAVIFWQTSWKLFRLELGPEHIYVSNYMKTVRYSYESVKKASYVPFLLWKIGSIELHQKGIFGKKIKFLLTSKKEAVKNLDEFIDYLKITSSEA